VRNSGAIGHPNAVTGYSGHFAIWNGSSRIPAESPPSGVVPSAGGPAQYGPYGHTGYYRFLDHEGYPAIKPPWGVLSAIDLNAGNLVWQVPLGEYAELTARGVEFCTCHPTVGDNVFIPAAVASPTVTLTTSIGGLQVESGATVTIPSATLGVSGNALISGTVTGAGVLQVTGSGTTLAGTISGPTLSIQGTVTQNGPLSSVGSIGLSAGSLTPAGFPLTTAANFNVSATGRLVMTNAADSVDVLGNFSITTSASGTGSYTAGILLLRGGFTQSSGAVDNFAATGTHRTRFGGGAAQTVNIGTPGIGASAFHDVEFADPAGVTLTANGFAASGLTAVTAGVVGGASSIAQLGGGLQATYANWHVSQTFFHAAPTVYPDSLPGNVTLLAPWTLTKSFAVDSVLLISGGGVLDVGGHHLAAGNILQGDRLVMHSPADTVDARQSLVVTSAVSGAGDLTDGLLIVRALLTQSGNATSFRPSRPTRITPS